MSKDPAFLFYSSDFLAGVQDLTMEERGQYITLLCLQHQKGRLTEKMIKLACHGNAAADVLAKFRHDEQGHYYNERLEAEAEKRRQAAEKQRQKANKRWNKSTGTAAEDTTAHAAAYAQQMPFYVNESRDENEKKVGGLGEGLSQHENNMAVEYVYRMTRRLLTSEEITDLWEAFKMQVEHEFYPSRNKQMTHFRDWVKNRINNGTYAKPTAESGGKPGTSAARIEALGALK